MKDGRKIAVEVKSFRGASGITDLQQALGQYRMYRFALARLDPDRTCFLALTGEAFGNVFRSVDLLDLIPSEDLKLLIFNAITEEVARWMPSWT